MKTTKKTAKKQSVVYIGDKKVQSITKNIVMFEDGTKETYTEKQLSYMVTDTPKDLTQMRDLVIDNVIPEIMEILEKHDVQKCDLQSIQQAITDTYNFAFLRAIGKAFGTYRENTHPAYFQDNIKFSDIIRVV